MMNSCTYCGSITADGHSVFCPIPTIKGITSRVKDLETAVEELKVILHRLEDEISQLWSEK